MDSRRFSWKGVHLVNQFTKEMVLPNENESKILLFGIFKSDGSNDGGRYILIRDYVGNRINVIEPNKPEADMQFSFQPITINETLESFELIPEQGNIFHGRYEPGTKFILLSLLTTTLP